MAKKKDTLTLDEVRRCVNLHLSFHNNKVVNVEDLAKELGVKKLDLWEFILEHKLYFVLRHVKNEGCNSIKWRFIKTVLESPMTEDEYKAMIQ